jgi:hypothetical protein
LHAVEEYRTDLQLREYTLIPSRLEDVFIRIVQEHEATLATFDDVSATAPEFELDPVSISRKFWSMFVLLWQHFVTDISFHLSLVAPIFFVLIGIGAQTQFWANIGVFLLVLMTGCANASNVGFFQVSL